MKKSYQFLILCILLIIVFGISLYTLVRPNKLGEIYSTLYEPLDYYINIIETNMDEITVSNESWDWAELKETNLEDEQLKNTYNLLVTDIRTCYLLTNDLKNKTFNNTKILSFKDKRSITNKQLLKLQKNENCLESFDKYITMTLSEDEHLSKKLQNQISIIIDYEPEVSNDKSFDELLREELNVMSELASLTSWLKVEYYSHEK